MEQILRRVHLSWVSTREQRENENRFARGRCCTTRGEALPADLSFLIGEGLVQEFSGTLLFPISWSSG